MQHTCNSCLAILVLIVCGESSLGSDAAVNAQAIPPELKLTIEPIEDSEFLVEGILSEPVPVPRISDFRLERIGDDVRHVPMLFGNERSLAWPDKATCTRVRLTLKPIRSRERDQQKLALNADDVTVRLYADALLHNEAEYRLTWNCRCGKAVTSRSVRFRYRSPPDANAPAVRTDLPERFYRCEILFRHDRVLFLGQTIVPRLDLRNFTMPAVGFNADGRSVVPPDPGYARIQQQINELKSKGDHGPVWKPRLAHRTHYFGAQADDHGLTISVSDLGTRVEFPEQPGDVAFEMWAGTNPYYPIEAVIFRFELLTGNVERLRQDPEHWKRRTKQISKEVLTRRDWLKESPRRFSIAAYVLADDELLALVRRELNDWLNAPPDRLDDHSTAPTETRRRIRSHISVLLCLGDPVDLPLLARLAAHESSGGDLMYYAGTIGKRYGVVVAASVLNPLLRRKEPASDPQHLSDLRNIEAGIPPRLRADDVLLSCARLLRRSPSEFGFRSAAARLLEVVPQQNLTKRKHDLLRTMAENRSGCWYAPSTAARKKAVVQMSKLLDQMRNP